MAALRAHGGSEFNGLFTVAAMEEEGGSGDPAVDAALFDAVVKLLDDKARVNELVQGGGQATTLLLALLRDAGLGHVAINKHLEHGISKRQFTNAGALGLAFQSAHRELMANLIENNGNRQSNAFAASAHSPLAGEPEGDRVATQDGYVDLLLFVLKHCKFGWQHIVARLEGSVHPLDVLVARALQTNTVAKLILLEPPSVLWSVYEQEVAPDKRFSRARFYELLDKSRLFTTAKAMGGVCNLHADAADDLKQLQVLLSALPPSVVRDVELRLQLFERHLFGSGIQHDASRTSQTASHNCAHVLGECGKNCDHVHDCPACNALGAVVELAAPHLDLVQNALLVQLAQKLAFVLGHTVIDAENADWLKTFGTSWVNGDRSHRGILYVDYMMKLLHVMAQHVSKRDFFGDQGYPCCCVVLFFDGQQYVLFLTNYDLDKQDYLTSLGVVEAAMALLKKHLPALTDIIGKHRASARCL